MKSSKLKQIVNWDKHDYNQQPLTNQQIKSVNHMTFSPKLYQSQELEIAEEYEQALEANSLEKIKQLLDKVV